MELTQASDARRSEVADEHVTDATFPSDLQAKLFGLSRNEMNLFIEFLYVRGTI